MNLVTPTELARIIESHTGEPFTRQAVHKAINEGLIPFVLQGKKKLVDLDNPHVQGYIRDDNRQREQAKKNDTAKLLKQKPVKTKIPSKLRDEIGGNIEELSDFEIKQRIKKAELRKKELQVLILEKKYLPTDFIEDVYITYLERFNTTIERLAGTYIKDIGKDILDKGEVQPKHIEAFTTKILEVIHNNKKSVHREKIKYEPRST
jgi:hypothetical protein